MYPNSIKKLIESFKCLPGIGSKSAERLAFSMIDFDKDNLTAFSEAVIGVRDNIHKCVDCGNISDEELCLFHSELLPQKCLMTAITLFDCIPFIYSAAVSEVRYGSSPKYSKLRPQSG